MEELSEIFGSDLTTAVFCLSSTVFLLLYAAGFFLSRTWNSAAGRASLIRRSVISGLGAALVAMAVAFGLHSASVTMTSATQQTEIAISVSPQELSRSGATKSLPVQKFEDFTFVFSNRD
jgi:hypothetical protein